MTTSRRVAVSLLALVSLSASVSYSQPAEAETNLFPLEPIPIRIGVPANSLQFLSLWVAEGAGYFEDARLDAQLIMPPMPGQIPQFLLQGQVDVTAIQPPLFLGMIGQEQPVKLFTNLLTNDPINLIVDGDVAEDLELDANAPLEERLEAIEGLKIGLAENVGNRLDVLFESVGLNADDLIEKVVLDGPEQIPGLLDGTVDALYTHTPFMEQALVDHDAFLLVNQSSGEVPALAHLQIHAMAATDSYIDDNPLAMFLVTRAIYRAQKLIHDDPEAAVEALLASSVPNLVQPRVEVVVDIYSPAVPNTPIVWPQGVVRAAKLFEGRPVHPDFTQIDPRDFIDNRFALLALLLG